MSIYLQDPDVTLYQGDVRETLRQPEGYIRRSVYVFPNNDEAIQAARLEPPVILDPFAGSGTTFHVARKHGRHSIGIELSPEYCNLAARRLAQQSLFA